MIARLAALAVLDVLVLAWCGVAAFPAGWALTGHAAASALAYAAWLAGGAATGLAPAILGVLGPLGILASLPFARLAERDAAHPDDVFGPVPDARAKPGTGQAVARMLDGRLPLAAPETLGSLVTIMRHGDVATRRRALETVVRSFQPALSPLIALALTDADQTIRALAAAASARVAQNLAVARAELEARCRDDGDATTGAALAALLADHARGNVLLSDSQRDHLRDDAVAAAGQSLPDDDPARTMLTIEALWAAGDHDAIDRVVASAPRGARWWGA